MSANSLWAMLYYRVEALHGIDAILDSFAFLRNYSKTNSPPVSDVEKEGVRILSLAAGAGVNIACYMDALKWPIEPGVRTELEQSYGSVNALCDDRDGDGYNAVNGDCDDMDPLRNISVAEIGKNGVDDDCDELVDEISLVEANAGTGSGDFPNSLQAQLPFEVDGLISSMNDTDSFSFSVPSSGRVRVTLCAQGGFVGWVTALQENGDFLDAPNYCSYQPEPGCVSNTFDFDGFTRAGLYVAPDVSGGDYSLTVTPAVDLLPDHSSFIQVSANPSGGMNLQIDDANGLFSSLEADEVEIWISGVGAQLFEPFASSLNVNLNTSTVPALQNGETYQVRIRPRANGLPLAAFSAGHLFRYEQSPAALPVIDHRFSGAWFDPSHDGEGFIVEILEGSQALVYWFTYQDDGAQRWMLGVGDVEGNRITIGDLMDTRGGRFGPNFDPDDVVLDTVGSLSLSFLDCSTAMVNYSVDDNGGHQSASRLIEIYGHGCDDNASATDSGISGSWFDPTHNGEGFIVEQFSANDALVFWFTYDDAGNQSWMINTGAIGNGTIFFPQLIQPVGGHFGRSYNPESVTQRDWGELTLELDCSGGIASYQSQAAGYSSGSQSLLPLTQLVGSACSD
jgi:hypothetical protein